MGALPPRLSVVTLGARDVGTLRRFYRGLGWAEMPGGSEEWCGFLLGGTLLAVYPLAALAAEAGAGEAAVPAWSGVTLAVNVDTTAEVDDAFAAAIAAGARPIAAPQERSWGGRSGYVADPEGNRWEITWAPGATFDERGALVGFDEIE